MEPLPVTGWPNGFRMAFEIVYDVCWRLRSHPDFLKAWIPAPADLGDLEVWIQTNEEKQIGYVRRGNPALLFTGFIPRDTPGEIAELGESDQVPWYGRCRVLAEQYLSIGDTREALFWINVGVESLLKERLSSAAIDFPDLTGSTSYWEEAKSIIAAQAPEIADKIEWPKTKRVPSIFQRLNYVVKRHKLPVPARSITSHYSKVQRDRNAIFHGDSASPLDTGRVKTAIDSFDWLLEHFVLQKSPQDTKSKS